MEQYRHYFDWAALGTIGATLLGLLPAIAAGLSAVYYGILIYNAVKAGHSKSE